MVHGGPSPGFFSPTLFECITYGTVSPTIEDVNDLDMTDKFTKISHAANMEELCQATEVMSEYLANAGCLRAVKCLQDKDLLLQDILLFQVVNRLHGPLERFKEGLKTLGLLDVVVEHKDAFRPLFCSPQKPLTADSLDDLFEIRYSIAGSNRWAQENITVAFWRDYLLDAEEGSSNCSLDKILMFATGCSVLPAIGLKPQPSIEFLHAVDALPLSASVREKFPTANTCVNCLRLPLHKDYATFKFNMDFGICNTQGFGQE
ncbi:putative G2/M phase-specific E3 ubiquitin-protein ligase-like [Triplophysa rosa]|uniref:G2/M phase-specific E3 ubiquitin-protein ligase-like n=2 Tax=Triplophysa rosa TaxID=992332 RepID=A0A9W7TKI8_TRIRA|nr:putative G2/M phase-specific E3 ubiquitin-protein ligase-like [Triplophysa rosa]